MSTQIIQLLPLFSILISILFYGKELVKLLEREDLSKKRSVRRDAHNELPNTITFVTLGLLCKIKELVE